MFGGSKHAESFDDIIQMAGGDSNAYTNADITNFYCTLPAINLDTALWLEADRMQISQCQPEITSVPSSKSSPKNIKKRASTNLMAWCGICLSDLCYKVHPYRWPTIGKQIEHIAEAKLEDVQAILYIHFTDPIMQSFLLQDLWILLKYLTWLNSGLVRFLQDLLIEDYDPRNLHRHDARILVDEGKYPSSVLYLAWLMDGRNGDDYYAFDLLSDVMSLGRSSIFYQRMVKVLKVCAHMDAYITGSEDKGLFIMELQAS